jgi:hypothetical protein
VPHAAEALIALDGAFLICALLGPARVTAPPTTPLFVRAGVVPGPDTSEVGPVADPTAEPTRARIPGAGRPRSLEREGTCRSPT